MGFSACTSRLEPPFRLPPGAPDPNRCAPGRGNGNWAKGYATILPSALLVPGFNAGDPNPSYLWPELAFPAGTVFTGLNEDSFDYFYSARVLTGALGHFGMQTQRWADTSDPANDNGQGPAAGNITG